MRVPSIPYMGSKSLIAEELVGMMPPSHTFVDLFAGGGAMTSAALLSGKFGRVVMNDTSPGLTRLYADLVSGRRTPDYRWVSREEFFRVRDTDPCVRCAWSFGNNGDNYIYGRAVEPFKKAFHYAAVYGDYTLFHELGIYPPECAATAPYERKLEIGRWLQKNRGKEEWGRLQNVERINHLQSLEAVERASGLQRLEAVERASGLQRLEAVERDYRLVNIPKGAVVYCDPPYSGTGKYPGAKFDTREFHEWARWTPGLVFVSEYAMPADFVCVKSIHKRVLISATDNTKLEEERLFVHESKIGLWHKMMGIDTDKPWDVSA